MNEFDTLRQVVARVTRFMNVYAAKVVDNNDTEQKGRVKVTIPELGIIEVADGVWVDVEQPCGVNVIPAVDDWVSVYFLGGDSAKPVVRGKITIAKDNVPKTEAKKRLLYKDDDLEVLLDQEDGKLSIEYAGETVISVDKKVGITIEGETEITCKKETKITCEKETKVTCKDKLTVEVSKDISIKGDTKIALEASGELTLKGSKVVANNHLEVS